MAIWQYRYLFRKKKGEVVANKGVKIRPESDKATILDLLLRDTSLKTSTMVNCENKGKVLLHVVSTLDVALGLQKIGSDSRGGTNINVGEVIYLEQGATVMIEVAESERVPYVGCQVQADTGNAPTSGRITITLIVENK